MIAVSLIIGSLLRFFMLISEKSFWGDEWFSLEIARLPLAGTFFSSLNDVHPPIYFLLLNFVVKILGTSELSLRLISFLAGLGLLVAIYCLSKEVVGKPSAVLTLFLASLSPYFLQCSNEVRSYSFFAFLSCLSALFFVRALARPTRERVIPYLLSTMVLVYTEHYAWFLLLGTSVVILYLYLKKILPMAVLKTQLVCIFFCVPSLALIVYQAIFRENMFLVGRMKEYSSYSILVKKIAGVAWHFSCGYSFSMLTTDRVIHYIKSSPFFYLSLGATLFSLAAVATGFFGIFRKNKPHFIFFFTGLVFSSVFLLCLYPIRLDARYLSFAAPFYIILLAYGLSLWPRAVRILAVVLIAFVSFFGSVHAILIKTDPIHKEDYRGMALFVVSRTKPGDAVYGLKPQMDYFVSRDIQAKDVVFLDDPSKLSARGNPFFSRLWVLGVVNMHPDVTERIYRDITAQMKLLGYAPFKPMKRFGDEESLLAYGLFVAKEERSA